MKQAHRWRWTALTVWIVLFTLTTGYSIRELRHQSREGVTAHQALCAFKLDLAYRVTASQEYLRTHPEGFPGIPASTLRNSIANQQRTLDSLSGLHCIQEGA